MEHLLTPHLGGIAGQAYLLPLPPGMTLNKIDVDGQPQIGLGDSFARRMRRVFGYIGEIELYELLVLGSQDVVTMLAKAKEPRQLRNVKSFARCLGVAAPPLMTLILATFQGGSSFRHPRLFRFAIQVSKAGGASCRVLRAENGGLTRHNMSSATPEPLINFPFRIFYHSVLTTTGIESTHRPFLRDLSVLEKVSVYPSTCGLNQDSRYVTPQLRGDRFQYLRLPYVNVACFSAPFLSTVWAAPPNPPPVLGAQIAAQSSARDWLLRRLPRAPAVKVPPSSSSCPRSL